MASEELKERLNDPGYTNWLKVTRALFFAKEAIHEFTENVIKHVHNDIKTKLGPGNTCTGTSACNTNKGKPPACKSCSNWVNEIKAYRSGGMICWKNANPQTWHNNHWEIAKCYMNAQGSKATAKANTGPDKTDISGIFNVVINCKEFQNNHLKEIKLAENVRQARNGLIHCATMSFTDKQMKDSVDTVIKFLEDEKELKNLPICEEKVKQIKLLRDNEIELNAMVEEDCISTTLMELSMESDEGAMPLQDKLLKLIRGDTDLQKKFDDKINKLNEKLKKMKEENDAKFLSVHDKMSDLQGQIEDLRKMAFEGSGSSFQNSSTSSVLGSFYKSALQSFAQKKKLDLPDYNSTMVEGGKFISTVSVDGKEFISERPKQSKREAEQNAAEVALRFLGKKDADDKNESEPTPILKPTAMKNDSPEKWGSNFKNLLQERAQRKKLPLPIYIRREEETGFLFDVLFDGCWYYPDISPQNKKVDAQQQAAQFVLAVLDSLKISMNSTSPEASNNATKKNEERRSSPRDEESAIYENNVSETDAKQESYDCDRTKSPESLKKEAIETKIISKPNESPTVFDKPDGKTYKSLLNEYAQKKGEDPPVYKEIPCERSNQYRSSVKISDRKFECVGAHSSKKMSRENAAMEAMKFFNSLSTESSSAHSSVASLSESEMLEPGNSRMKEKTENAKIRSVANIPTTASGEMKDTATCIKAEGRPIQSDQGSLKRKQESNSISRSPANPKGALQQYAQKRKLDLRYENVQDPGTKEYLSKVFLGKRCFKGKQSNAKQKEAEKHVAEIAMNILEGCSGTLDHEYEKLLKDFHEGINLPLFPKYSDAIDRESGEFTVQVKVVEKYEFTSDDKKTKKKDAEMLLAEKALKSLEDEKKIIPPNENAKSRLNLFLQSQGVPTPEYEVPGNQAGGFSGRLSFYCVVEYESLTSQPTKEEAFRSAAMSACNAMNLL